MVQIVSSSIRPSPEVELSQKNSLLWLYVNSEPSGDTYWKNFLLSSLHRGSSSERGRAGVYPPVAVGSELC